MEILSALSLVGMQFVGISTLYGMMFNDIDRRATGRGIVKNAKFLLKRNITNQSAIFAAIGMVAEKIAL